MGTTAGLAERIEASREALTRAAEQAGECHESASIFGWAYGRVDQTPTGGAV
ncbi:hypothetical protein [Streptomyces sp. NRRL S-474]|uniref:hypothetical protein n=1 Tax=Streptomyces sp. NRRL S-474 TaxID=1463909 RepID=UPI000AFD1518|nr:hypothetical protein [Streptomyces sp. NRRL S-474]